MRKTAVMLFCLLLPLVLAGCAAENMQSAAPGNAPQSEPPAAEAPGTGSYVITVGQTADALRADGTVLPEGETAEICTAMAQSEYENGWVNDAEFSAVSCMISIRDHNGEVTYAYSADSGVIHNTDNMCSLQLTEAARNTVNGIFSDHGFLQLPRSIDFGVQYIRTDGYHDGEEYPKALWITSTEELADYYAQNREKYDLDSKGNPGTDETIGFADAVESYDEKFFADHDLIVIVLEEGSGSVRHEVTGVSLLPSIYNRVQYFLQPEIRRIVPEVGTADMAEWHILIEIDREYGAGSSDLLLPEIR